VAKNLKVNGIIIAENNSNDYDKMLTMLTPNLGKISCSAKGARRTKSQLLRRHSNIYIWRIHAI
jgi:recombinational DNA repair protein (RecF pathway)